MADSVILVTIPGSGDQIQALKAGVFEIADIFVVNKSDLAGKDKQVLFIKQLLELDYEKNKLSWNPPVVETRANVENMDVNGINNLVREITNHWTYLLDSGNFILKRKNKIRTELIAILQFFAVQQLVKEKNGSLINEAIEKISKNELDPYTFIHSFISSLK